MYMNILVPVSFDTERDAQEAIDVAKALAGKGARITLLHVIEHIPSYAISYMSQDYLDEAAQAVQAELEKMAEGIENAKAVVIEGHSGRSILDWAKENWADCIVIASHRPGMQDYLLGSTAAHVVRHAGCAVHVVR
ncbi:universal stress protein [Marimonas lutisalis]|uniref:universal stress protein n=1 Tax=Marimonas lutisalis TaxID=2545756 RepID=UPI0010F67A60|nr:universal stress protein [Marimonas lutisalis]